MDFGSVSFGWAIYLLLLIYLGTLCLGGDAAAERGLYGLAFVLEDILIFSQDGDSSTSALTSNDPTSEKRGNAKSQCHPLYLPKPEVDASQTYSPSWVPGD